MLWGEDVSGMCKIRAGNTEVDDKGFRIRDSVVYQMNKYMSSQRFSCVRLTKVVIRGEGG